MRTLLDPAFSLVRLTLLLDSAVKGMILLAVAGVVSRLVQRASAAFRHLIWCVAIAGSLALPLLSMALPGWHWPVLPPGLFAVPAAPPRTALTFGLGLNAGAPNASQPQPGPGVSPPGGTVVGRGSGPTTDTQLRGTPSPRPIDTRPTSLHWSAWLVLVWAAGAALVAVPLLVGTLRLWRVSLRARPVTEEAWVALFDNLASRLRLRQSVTLQLSEQVRLPMMWGPFQPVVMLPVEAEDWPEERRGLVLLHELAHVQRADCLTQLLAQIACVVYWFNPLAWLAAWQLRVERERACDDRVLAVGTSPAAYAHHLLEIARAARRAGVAPLAGVAMARPSQMEGRLLAVLDSTLSRGAVPRLAARLAVAAGLCLVLPLAAIQPSAREARPIGPPDQELSVRKLPPLPKGFGGWSHQFSPDGTKIALAHVGPPYYATNIAVYESASRGMRLVTDYNKPAEPEWPDLPIWSPDSATLVFRVQDKDRNSDLRIAPPGGTPRTLYRSPAHSAILVRPTDWLRDGSALVVVLEHPNKTYTLGMVSATAGEFQPLRALRSDPGIAQASPDGRFLVYTSGPRGSRDLEIMTTRGRSRHPLAAHPADEEQPLWSPDGRFLIFKSRRRGAWALWGIAIENGQAVGEPFMVKDGMDSTWLYNWSPQGQLFFSDVYHVRDVYSVRVNPRTGGAEGEPREIPYERTGGNTNPAWSPDGDRLAFFSDTPGDRTVLVVVPSAGGAVREYPVPSVQPFPVSRRRLDWLPDGSGISFPARDANGQLALIRLNLATGESRSTRLPRGVSGLSASAEWTRDGSAYLTAIEPEKDRPARLIEHHLATGHDRVIWTATPPVIDIRYPRFSPDYKAIAFVAITSEAPDGQSKGLMVLDLATRQARMASPTLGGRRGRSGPRAPYLQESPPSWSPDGRHLVVVVNGEGGKVALHIVSRTGGDPQKIELGDTKPWWHPSWSPDGNQIAFSTLAPQSSNWVMENAIPPAQLARSRGATASE
jgi:Tol biopolymer transport system component/beta-lactamase regulating signal transducer with metallopeptidase domain